MFLYNKFIIIIPTYNAQDSIIEALDSIITQDFDDIGIIIRDDLSTDDTSNVVKNYLQLEDGLIVSHRFKPVDIIYIQNNVKYYGAGNTFDSVLKFVKNPQAVIGVVDGDDKLIDKNALSKIKHIYDTFNSWLVWSQHKLSNTIGDRKRGFSSTLPGDEEIYSNRNYWAVSHFRTCKAWLYSLLDKNDLIDPFEPGSYCKVAADAALLYPLIELCGNEHSYFLDEELYLYNNHLSTNENVVFKEEVSLYTNYIRQYNKRYLKFDPSSNQSIRTIIDYLI